MSLHKGSQFVGGEFVSNRLCYLMNGIDMPQFYVPQKPLVRLDASQNVLLKERIHGGICKWNESSAIQSG